MGERKTIEVDEVYVRVKRAINDLARVAWGLKDRAPHEPDDRREQDAFDALDDVCLLTSELTAVWDRLWRAISRDRTDPIVWARSEVAHLDPVVHERRAERERRQLQAAFDLRRAIEEFEREELDFESAQPHDDSCDDGDDRNPESVA